LFKTGAVRALLQKYKGIKLLSQQKCSLDDRENNPLGSSCTADPHNDKDLVVALDVGSGTGLLSMLAAQAGIPRTIGRWLSNMAKLGRQHCFFSSFLGLGVETMASLHNISYVTCIGGHSLLRKNNCFGNCSSECSFSSNISLNHPNLLLSLQLGVERCVTLAMTSCALAEANGYGDALKIVNASIMDIVVGAAHANRPALNTR
jgi:hypothetical protein